VTEIALEAIFFEAKLVLVARYCFRAWAPQPVLDF
jgi:hypothetical protein